MNNDPKKDSILTLLAGKMKELRSDSNLMAEGLPVKTEWIFPGMCLCDRTYYPATMLLP